MINGKASAKRTGKSVENVVHDPIRYKIGNFDICLLMLHVLVNHFKILPFMGKQYNFGN